MKSFDRSLYRFPIVGLVNTFFGLFVIYIAKLIGLDDIKSNLIGYSCGIAVSFFLNKNWTFSHDGSGFSTVLKFLTVTLVAYFSNLLVVVLLVDVFKVNGFIAQAMAVPFYTLIAYLGCRKFAFPENKNGQKK